MSRQTELMAISQSKGQKRFRFYLQNASKGILLLKYSPDGWRDAKFLIERNLKYMGLVRKVSVNELTFQKDSRDYIRDVYESQGINAKITFTVERLGEDHVYITYFSGIIDMSTYHIDQTGVKVGIIDNTLTEKIKNRENTKVNLRGLTSIEGFEIPPFSNENPNIEFPAYNIQAAAAWIIDASDPITTNDDHYVPLLLTTSEFTEAQSQTIDGTDPLFLNSAANRTVHLSGTIEGIVNADEEVHHFSFFIYLYVNGIVIKSYNFNATDAWFLTFNQTIDEDFTVNLGEDISLRASVTNGGLVNTTEYYSCQITLTEDIEAVISTSVYAMQIYEALLRTCQLISDSNDCLKSDYFGRTDTPIVTYPVDGQFGSISKGINIRGAIGLNDTLPVSFSELFDTLNKIFCLGMGIELVSGVNKVVIEDLDYWFDAHVVIDISSRVQEDAIEKDLLTDWHYNRIKVGYNSFEYPEAIADGDGAHGTLAEFNTKSEFSTVISALDNDLDLVCKYRADTQGIINLRKAGVTADDEKGDEDIFVIDTVRKVLDPFWTARTNEDFTLVTGGIDAATWYNLDYSPKRNLLRHGMMIRAGLERNLGTYLRWQATDKNTTLQTQRTAETAPVIENADELVNNLTPPIWWAEAYSCEVEFDYSDLTAILANPKGLIKLSSTKYGWILNLEVGSKERKATLKLLRANTTNIKVIEL